jgi:phosphate transport system permease protein
MTDLPADAAPDAIEKRRSGRVAERSRETRASVVYGERIAKWVITVGGLLVILAVIGIMVFLFQVVMPLLSRGEVTAERNFVVQPAEDVAWLNADEFQSLAIRVATDGRATTFHVPTGRVLSTAQLDFDGATATAVAGILTRDMVAFGFEDGSVRFGTIGFEITTTARRNAPADLVPLDQRDFYSGETIYTPVQTGDYRTIRPIKNVGEPEQISEVAIVALDYRRGGTVERPSLAYITVDAAGVARVSRSTIQRNLMTGAETVRTRTATLPTLPEGVRVTDALLSSAADRAFIATDAGELFRYDLRDANNPVLAERRRVFDGDVALTSLTFLNGELALVAGGSNGAVDVFFRLQPPGAAGSDGYEMVRARSHAPQGAAVIGMSEAIRDKGFVTLGADGSVWMRHSTSDQVLHRWMRSGDVSSPALALVFPRSNGVMVADATGRVQSWAFEDPHPEITLGVLFGRKWYEGYPEPGFTWQSTSGTDLFEPKYSLVPLIFGTMKATLYAMLFAAPIALMAAIYTSEFVHRGVRATVKPVMEMMESLPTVVLGFIAALVLAPFVEEWIGAVLLGFIALPLGLMLGAFLWQMLPADTALRWDGLPKFGLMITSILVCAFVAYKLGPLFEDLLFYGDFKLWTTGAIGTGTPFMFLILLPLSYIFVAWVFRKTYGHVWRDHMRSQERASAGRSDFLRWIAMLVAGVIVSWTVSALLTAIGFDPRGSIIDSYQQRNALVVGFIMAFAVIPNVYTLAEDALNSVPGHLRAGSLACGATPWQTAIWVILPTAMSGVFSAVMIGMGRAVGETMIVVMAAGNTPIMEWNIFSGLRTLSANIAIELPEAVKDGTNYRVLFLAALTLFVMTFVINTIAELIRQRFRKRAFNL